MPIDFTEDEEDSGIDFTPDQATAVAEAPQPIIAPQESWGANAYVPQSRVAAPQFWQDESRGVPPPVVAPTMSPYGAYVTDKGQIESRIPFDPSKGLAPLSKLALTPQEVEAGMEAVVAPFLPERERRALMEAPLTPSPLAKSTAGFTQGAYNTAESLTSPMNLGLLVGTAGLSEIPAASRLLSGAFTADMARQVPEQARRLGEAVASKDPEAITKAATELAATGAFTATAGAHTAGLGKPGVQADVRPFITDPQTGRPLVVMPETMRELAKEPSTQRLPVEAPITTELGAIDARTGKRVMSQEEVQRRFGGKSETLPIVENEKQLTDEKLATESANSIVKRTSIPEREAAFAARAAAGKRVVASLKEGDIIVDEDGGRHVVSQILRDAVFVHGEGEGVGKDREFHVQAELANGGKIERVKSTTGAPNAIREQEAATSVRGMPEQPGVNEPLPAKEGGGEVPSGTIPPGGDTQGARGTAEAGPAEVPLKEVTVKARTPEGEEIGLKMEAGEAQRRLTQRKTVLEALRDCMG